MSSAVLGWGLANSPRAGCSQTLHETRTMVLLSCAADAGLHEETISGLINSHLYIVCRSKYVFKKTPFRVVPSLRNAGPDFSWELQHLTNCVCRSCVSCHFWMDCSPLRPAQDPAHEVVSSKSKSPISKHTWIT